jgi:hypothetical protein
VVFVLYRFAYLGFAIVADLMQSFLVFRDNFVVLKNICCVHYGLSGVFQLQRVTNAYINYPTQKHPQLLEMTCKAPHVSEGERLTQPNSLLSLSHNHNIEPLVVQYDGL